MASTHVSQVVLILNGVVITDVKSIGDQTRTNREQIMGMTPTGQPAGWVEGTTQTTLSLDLYIPKSGEPNWVDITAGTIATVPRDGGPIALYSGVVVTEVNSEYNENGHAVRKVQAFAQRLVTP